MKFISTIFLILLASCATHKVEKRTFSDVDDIKESDFIPVNLVPYSKGQDTYSQSKEDLHSILASESLQRAVKFDEDYAKVNTLGEVSIACYENNFQKAKALLQGMTRTYHKNPMFWNTAGVCASLEGQRRKALLLFNKALGLKKNYAPAYNNLGVMYIGEEDYSRALVAFEKAKKLGTLSRTPRFNLAHLYLYFGLYDKAIQNASSLVQVSSVDVDALKMIATGYLMKNDVQNSLKYFSQIKSSYLSREDIGINYALALYLSGDKVKASDILSDVDLSKSKDWLSYFNDVKKIIEVK